MRLSLKLLDASLLATMIALTLASCTSAPPPSPDYLSQGKAQGDIAGLAAQTAVTPEQWGAAADQWQKAIDQLDQVPRRDSDYAEAQATRDEYIKYKLAAFKFESDLQGR